MIVIAIIAAIEIPNLLAAKPSAHETASIATLRNRVSSQAQVQASGRIDKVTNWSTLASLGIQGGGLRTVPSSIPGP